MKGTDPALNGLRVPRKAARQDTRTTNLRLVLQHLFTGDALSRADLARATELTPATVSTLVAELESAGLVVKAGMRRATTQVGKPPTMYEIKPDGRSVLALDLSNPEKLQSAIIDLAGRIEARLERATTGPNGSQVVEQIKELVTSTLAEATSPVLGVGIGTPGVVTPEGHVIEASTFDWHHVALRHEIEVATGLPVHIGNDANVAAIAEYTKGGHHDSNLAVVKIGSGVGAGFILNGQPFRGDRSAAGEIGHLVVNAGGPECRCGNRGCLETYVSLPAIKAATPPGGTRAAVLHEAGERLGVALSAIVAILNVDHILIAAPTDVLGADFCEIVQRSLRARCLDTLAETVSVGYTSLGQDIVLLGAAGLVLSRELGVA